MTGATGAVSERNFHLTVLDTINQTTLFNYCQNTVDIDCIAISKHIEQTFFALQLPHFRRTHMCNSYFIVAKCFFRNTINTMNKILRLQSSFKIIIYQKKNYVNIKLQHIANSYYNTIEHRSIVSCPIFHDKVSKIHHLTFAFRNCCIFFQQRLSKQNNFLIILTNFKILLILFNKNKLCLLLHYQSSIAF